MSSEYTPPTDEVRDAYCFYLDGGGAEFDRWLAAHDAEVARAARVLPSVEDVAAVLFECLNPGAHWATALMTRARLRSSALSPGRPRQTQAAAGSTATTMPIQVSTHTHRRGRRRS